MSSLCDKPARGGVCSQSACSASPACSCAPKRRAQRRESEHRMSPVDVSLDAFPVDFIQAAQRLPAVVQRVLVQDALGDAREEAAALMAALPSRMQLSSVNGDLKRIPHALSASACDTLRAAVDRQRSVARDSVDLAPEHQRNLTVEELAALIGQKETAAALSLPSRLRGDFDPKDFRVEMMVRRYTRDTRPWIQFHCDKAAITVNIALAADELHTGGRLICVIDDELQIVERAEGEATVHPSSLLHAVTAMRGSGCTRYSLIIFFHRVSPCAWNGTSCERPFPTASSLLSRACINSSS